MTQIKNIPKPHRFLSLRIKMLIGFTVIFTGVFAITYYWFYRYATGLALDRLQDNLVNTYRIANAGINGDRFEELAAVDAGNNPDSIESNTLYQEHQDWLLQLAEADSRALAYTYVAGDRPNELLWIGDAYRVLLPDRSPTRFKEPYLDEIGLYEGLQQDGVIMEPSRDEWGTWIVAYGPIRNSSGEIVGGLGVDFSAAYLDKVQRDVKMFVLGAFAIAYAALIGLVYVFSRKLTKPIIYLTELSGRIGDGDYSEKDSLATFSRDRQFHDEISRLAAVFETMVTKVYRREEALKSQISELKIEIDHAKRSQQVKEIVDTEYFQNLQKKARMMRQKRQEEDQ